MFKPELVALSPADIGSAAEPDDPESENNEAKDVGRDKGSKGDKENNDNHRAEDDDDDDDDEDDNDEAEDEDES